MTGVVLVFFFLACPRSAVSILVCPLSSRGCRVSPKSRRRDSREPPSCVTAPRFLSSVPPWTRKENPAGREEHERRAATTGKSLCLDPGWQLPSTASVCRRLSVPLPVVVVLVARNALCVLHRFSVPSRRDLELACSVFRGSIYTYVQWLCVL